MQTFAELLRPALIANGFEVDTPRSGAQERFRKYLEAHFGVDVTAQAVSLWLRGDRVPTTSHLIAILDALVVPADDRDQWLKAVASHRPVPSSNRADAA